MYQIQSHIPAQDGLSLLIWLLPAGVCVVLVLIAGGCMWRRPYAVPGNQSLPSHIMTVYPPQGVPVQAAGSSNLAPQQHQYPPAPAQAYLSNPHH